MAEGFDDDLHLLSDQDIEDARVGGLNKNEVLPPQKSLEKSHSALSLPSSSEGEGETTSTNAMLHERTFSNQRKVMISQLFGDPDFLTRLQKKIHQEIPGYQEIHSQHISQFIDDANKTIMVTGLLFDSNNFNSFKTTFGPIVAKLLRENLVTIRNITKSDISRTSAPQTFLIKCLNVPSKIAISNAMIMEIKRGLKNFRSNTINREDYKKSYPSLISPQLLSRGSMGKHIDGQKP